MSEENEVHMGTVEPVYKADNLDNIDCPDKADTLAFIRGAIRKYKDTKVSNLELLNYIEGLLQ